MEQFGKYQLIRRIGVGGMAEVFLARTAVAHGLSKDLVIKKIHPAFARSRHFMSMFVAEAKIALGLNHPNIVQVFDFGTIGGTFFLAMEYIEGLDLLRLSQASQQAGRPIAPELGAYIVQEVARGLDYAHRKTDAFGDPLSIVHRDVSPQNVLVSRDGAVKLVDFGVARARGVQDDDDGVVKGKFAYMSPEQARGEPVDGRSDVYAAGLVLFELCCGRPMFRGKGKDILAQVKSGAIVRPRELAPHLPESLEHIILRTLAFHPDERWAGARALQEALGRFVLERVQRTGSLVDASMLAEFVEQVAPPDPRARVQAVASPGTGSVPDHLDTGAATDPAAPVGHRETRERKHVLVVAGQAHGAWPGTADLVDADLPGADLPEAFLEAARGIAFKHHAYVHELDAAGLMLVIGVPVAAEDDLERTVDLALALIDALDAISHAQGLPQGVTVRLGVGIQRGIAVLDIHDGSPVDAPGTIELADWTGDVAQRLAAEAGGGQVLVSGGVHQLARHGWRFAERASLHLRARAPAPEPGASGSVSGSVGGSMAGASGSVSGSVVGGAPEREPHAVHDPPDPDAPRRIRVHRLLGPKDRSERLREQAASSTELIGRELELKALRDAYREVLLTRTKRKILLAGEAGVGKRALVNAFLRTIPVGQAVVLRAMTRVAASHTPYAVIADLTRDLLGLHEATPAAEVRRRIEAMAPLLYPDGTDTREARGTIDTIYTLLTGTGTADGTGTGTGTADGTGTGTADGTGAADRTGTGAGGAISTIDAEERRQRILQAMLRVEQRMAQDKPLVVIGEDAHWSDGESLALFRKLLEVESRRPVLGIITSRPDTRVARMADELRADILHMEELDPDSAAALITRRFAPDQDVDELVKQILARTGGNPLFIREVLDSLIERGIVAMGDQASDQAVAAPAPGREPQLLYWVERDAPIQVPSSVETLLATRIDRLPASEKEALLHAAVLGRACRPESLAYLLERPADAELAALVERDILRPRDGRYMFRSNMMMSVAYGLLPAAERTRLHRRAAERRMNAPTYRAGQDDAVIARHLELAGDALDAADRYLRAAAHAVDVGASSDAFRQLTRALRLLPADDHERRFHVHRRREEILRLLARKPEQLREIHGMRAAAERLRDDPALLSLAHARLAQFYLEAGKAGPATRSADEALTHARAAGARLAEAEAQRLRAGVARLLGRGSEALDLCQQALDLCRHDDGRDGLTQRAAILNSRGTALWSMGRLEDAIESFAEALVIYRTLRVPRQEAFALNNMGVIFSAMGEYEEALAHYKSSLELNQSLGDRASVALKLANIGQTYADVGDFERAERYLRKAMKLAEQHKDRETVMDAVVTLGQVYWQTGDSARAQAQFDRGLRLAREARNRYQEIRAEIYLCLARLDAGDAPEEVLALARAATVQAQRMPMPVGQIYGLAVQGMALAALGRAREGADASAQAVALQSARKQSEGAEHILHIHASLCEAAGRMDDAAEAIRLARRELDAKAGRLRNPKLRAIYLDTKVSRAITAAHARLHARA